MALQISRDQLTYPNADKISDLIEAEPDPVIRSLMRLVHEEFILAHTEGKRPERAVDMLFCFEVLQKSFRRKDALENALRGDFGDSNAELEWT